MGEQQRYTVIMALEDGSVHEWELWAVDALGAIDAARQQLPDEQTRATHVHARRLH